MTASKAASYTLTENALTSTDGMTLGLTGFETFTMEGVPAAVDSSGKAPVHVKAELNGDVKTIDAIARIDTPQEAEYYRSGGILPYVLRQLVAAKAVS